MPSKLDGRFLREISAPAWIDALSFASFFTSSERIVSAFLPKWSYFRIYPLNTAISYCFYLTVPCFLWGDPTWGEKSDRTSSFRSKPSTFLDSSTVFHSKCVFGSYNSRFGLNICWNYKSVWGFQKIAWIEAAVWNEEPLRSAVKYFAAFLDSNSWSIFIRLLFYTYNTFIQVSILFRDSGPRGGDLDIIHLKIPDISVLLWTWGVWMLQDEGNAVISFIFKDLKR